MVVVAAQESRAGNVVFTWQACRRLFCWSKADSSRGPAAATARMRHMLDSRPMAASAWPEGVGAQPRATAACCARAAGMVCHCGSAGGGRLAAARRSLWVEALAARDCTSCNGSTASLVFVLVALGCTSVLLFEAALGEWVGATFALLDFGLGEPVAAWKTADVTER